MIYRVARLTAFLAHLFLPSGPPSRTALPYGQVVVRKPAIKLLLRCDEAAPGAVNKSETFHACVNAGALRPFHKTKGFSAFREPMFGV